MVELRKRKEAPVDRTPPPARKKATPTPRKQGESSHRNPAPVKVSPGDTVSLETFGGEIETNDGRKTSLKILVEESKAGVVLFTYPKASTPGCTTQACLFRDEFTSLTATGYSIYGLSTDSPKSNTNFKEKQKLPYALLCDPKASLIAAIGMKKSPSGTIRGVFVVDKEGKVAAAEPGGPAATVEVVRKLVGGKEDTNPADKGSNGDAAKADVAAEVADSAQKLDGGT